MKNIRKLFISTFFGCFMLMHIAGAAEISLLIENNDGKQVQLSILDKALMEAALYDINVQYQLYGEKLTQRSRIDGAIEHKGQEYWYEFIQGELLIYSDKGKPTKIPVREIVEAIVQIGEPEGGVNRCPLCSIVGIIIAQNACEASQGGEYLYCISVCDCGVREGRSTCFLGIRSTKCYCRSCSHGPRPRPEYPLPDGSVLIGTPWAQNNDPGNGYPLCVNPSINGDC